MRISSSLTPDQSSFRARRPERIQVGLCPVMPSWLAINRGDGRSVTKPCAMSGRVASHESVTPNRRSLPSPVERRTRSTPPLPLVGPVPAGSTCVSLPARRTTWRDLAHRNRVSIELTQVEMSSATTTAHALGDCLTDRSHNQRTTRGGGKRSWLGCVPVAPVHTVVETRSECLRRKVVSWNRNQASDELLSTTIREM